MNIDVTGVSSVGAACGVGLEESITGVATAAHTASTEFEVQRLTGEPYAIGRYRAAHVASDALVDQNGATFVGDVVAGCRTDIGLACWGLRRWG